MTFEYTPSRSSQTTVSPRPRQDPFIAVLQRLFPLVLAGTLLGCQNEAPQPTIDHMALAKELEARATAGGKALAPDDPVVEQMIQELQLVPDDSPDKEAAEKRAKELRRAQKSALWATHEEEGGSYEPAAPSGGSGGAGKGRAGGDEHDPSKGSYVAGVWTPFYNVDVKSLGGKSSSSSSGSHRGGNPAAKAASGPLAVTIYTASWCGVCKAAKAYMRSNGIAYVEKDVEKDPGARSEANAKTGGATGVPIIDVNGEIMVGFDKSAFSQMVSRHQG